MPARRRPIHHLDAHASSKEISAGVRFEIILASIVGLQRVDLRMPGDGHDLQRVLPGIERRGEKLARSEWPAKAFSSMPLALTARLTIRATSRSESRLAPIEPEPRTARNKAPAVIPKACSQASSAATGLSPIADARQRVPKNRQQPGDDFRRRRRLLARLMRPLTRFAAQIDLSPLGRGKPNPQTADSAKGHLALGQKMG